jgi:hypothetical protein
VQCFARAFAADAKLADDLGAGYRYRAACSAALAGRGQGADVARPDAAGRARLRRQAQEWLRAELARLTRQLGAGTPQERNQAQSRLRSWQTDRALAGVRDAAPLATLPSAERAVAEAVGRRRRDLGESPSVAPASVFHPGGSRIASAGGAIRSNTCRFAVLG